ncbi:MAG: exodeoxyribonuclease VII large subunit [Candidatus Hydrothermarchaeaceae archaeon]
MRLDDAGLLKISLGTSTIGLLLLLLVSSASQPATVSIGEIDYDEVGSLVSIEGSIASKRVHKDGHIFLKVEDGTGKISTVVFSSEAEKLDSSILECLVEGRRISVTGRVEEYRGALEVIPKRGDGLKCSTS